MLLIKPSSLGDVIHAFPFLHAVKETWPDIEVDWVISRNLKGILEDNPLINELIVIDKETWKDMKKIPATLSEIFCLKKYIRGKKYDMAVDLQGLFRSGLLTYFTGAKIKAGFQDAREGSRFFYNKKVPVDSSSHAVDKCLEVAKAIGAKAGTVTFPINIDKEAKAKLKGLLGKTGEYVLIVPSARWLSKRWPVEKFASLIKMVPLPCVITGNKDDGKIAQEIIRDNSQKSEVRSQQENSIIDLCGKTDLKALVALVAGAKAVVTNDTGPMHIAAALNKPVIAVFGPTDPFKTGPCGWQDNANLNVIKVNVPCSPCRKKECDEMICMDMISVNSVYDVLEKYL